MDIKLRVLEGKNAGHEIPIKGRKFLIGRSEDCQLRPGSELISRHHCVILAEDGYLGVRDFGSKNGTYVNDERVVGEQELKTGDRITVGPLKFELQVSYGLNSKKQPPVADLKEAVARTAQNAAKDPVDVGQWLASEATNETKTVSIFDTQGGAPPEPKRTPEPQRTLEPARAAEPARAVEASRPIETARSAESDREAELRRELRELELKREAELQREAEIRREIEARLEAERKREAEIRREIEAKREAELKREAEVRREMEAPREAEQKRQDELKREAERKRQYVPDPEPETTTAVEAAEAPKGPHKPMPGKLPPRAGTKDSQAAAAAMIAKMRKLR